MMTGVVLLGFLGWSLSNSLIMSTRRKISEDMLDRDKDPYRFTRQSHILHTVEDKSNSEEMK